MKYRTLKKIILAVIMIGIPAVFYALELNIYFSLAYIKESRDVFAAYYADHRVMTLMVYFCVYILVTSLSLPGATVLTLAGGALFGFFTCLVTVSFASSIGATLSAFVSRYIFRNWVEQKFSDTVSAVNSGMDKEGIFYLFTMRLIPAFPFFMINIVFGLTRMKLFTFYWVSQIGMLPGAVLYVNAGREIGKIQSPADILSPVLIISFIVLGLFPLTVKRLMKFYKDRKNNFILMNSSPDDRDL